MQPAAGQKTAALIVREKNRWRNVLSGRTTAITASPLNKTAGMDWPLRFPLTSPVESSRSIHCLVRNSGPLHSREIIFPDETEKMLKKKYVSETQNPRIVPMKAWDPLVRQGWEMQGFFDEPRLSDVVEAYREIGLEVRLEPFDPKFVTGCTECLKQHPENFKIVYTRRKRSGNRE